MKFKRQQLDGPNINMTPMLDGVFLLLLFFAVSTSFRHGSQLNLTLPTAKGVVVEQQAHPVVVAVAADGRYSVDGRVLGRQDAATLKTVMSQLGTKDRKHTPLIIRADAMSTHQAVVTIMDVAGQLGFVNVSITTVKPKSGH